VSFFSPLHRLFCFPVGDRISGQYIQSSDKRPYDPRLVGLFRQCLVHVCLTFVSLTCPCFCQLPDFQPQMQYSWTPSRAHLSGDSSLRYPCNQKSKFYRGFPSTQSSPSLHRRGDWISGFVCGRTLEVGRNKGDTCLGHQLLSAWEDVFQIRNFVQIV
jgi:hypothetical protein